MDTQTVRAFLREDWTGFFLLRSNAFIDSSESTQSPGRMDKEPSKDECIVCVRFFFFLSTHEKTVVSFLVFKSSLRVPTIKYLGRRGRDLHVLAAAPGSH